MSVKKRMSDLLTPYRLNYLALRSLNPSAFATGLDMGLKRYTKYVEYPNVMALRNSVADKLAAENNYCF